MTADYDTLRKLAQEATPGPWLDMASPPTEVRADVRGPGPMRSYVACSCRVADAAFIAAANPQVVLGLLDEIARLQAGGCARDQRTTQFCAEAVQRDATIKALRARIVYLEAGLDAIARVNDGNGRCLSACASNVNPDADCDCGYCAAEEPGPFAADVVAGEANLYGALRLDKIVDDYLDSARATLPTDRSPK